MLVVLVAELSVRATSARYAEPLHWPRAEFQLKADRMEVLGRTGGASVVFVGSSVASFGFDPLHLSPRPARPTTGYNAAILGMSSIAQMRVWMETTVLPRLRPDIVVIGLSSLEVDANDSSLDQDHIDFVNSREVRRLTGRETRWDKLRNGFEQNVYLSRYRDSLRKPLSLLQGDELSIPDGPVSESGMVLVPEVDYEENVARTRAKNGSRPGPEVLSAKHVQDLRSMVEWLGEKNIGVVLVLVPTTADSLRTEGHLRIRIELRESLAAVAAGAGAMFVDTDVWDTSLFRDSVHLNGAGRAQLTTRVDQALAG